MMQLPIYPGYSATTTVDPRVAQNMIPYLTGNFGNPASRSLRKKHGLTEVATEAANEKMAALAVAKG